MFRGKLNLIYRRFNLKTKAINSGFTTQFSRRLLSSAHCHYVELQPILKSAAGLRQHMTVRGSGMGVLWVVRRPRCGLLKYTIYHHQSRPIRSAHKSRSCGFNAAKRTSNPKMWKCYRQFGEWVCLGQYGWGN